MSSVSLLNSFHPTEKTSGSSVSNSRGTSEVVAGDIDRAVRPTCESALALYSSWQLEVACESRHFTQLDGHVDLR